MAIPVASLPFTPTVTPDVPVAAPAPAPTNPTGETSPFQEALAAAQSSPASFTDAEVDVAAAEPDAAESAVIDVELDTETDTETETDTDTDPAPPGGPAPHAALASDG